ncbi:MAG: C25 family cysteine peptidase [bacterium]
MSVFGRCGDAFTGIAVVLAVAIPFGICLANPEIEVELSLPSEELQIHDRSLWFPIPECDDAQLDLEAGGLVVRGSLVETARVRDQRIGLFRFGRDLGSGDEVSVRAKFAGATSEQCVPTGPLSGILSGALLGYGAAEPPVLLSGPGTVTRALNLAQCADARPDILMVAGNAIYASSYVDSLALMWATRMGLNVAVIDVANISTSSPVMIRDFIKGLYDLRCAANFGDGHLGFVVLLGDAYEDDNTTRMVPDYDGYGGTSEASDHYYACVSGEDDFEDLMLGRVPAGNTAELVNFYVKVRDYSPLPADSWTKSLLLIAGCFFAYKDDYIDLFDQFESYVPDEYQVSRLYRYDYPANSTGDALACQAVSDSLNQGFLFALYSGDGDRWDWGGVGERTYRSTYIPGLANNANLPIMLSIACSNGWFDNRTSPYVDGGYDCFAERLLVAPAGGAVACVASPRETGGGATTVFAHEILKSAFVNGSSFLGELMLEAKTRHLLNLGSVSYVRQFTIFGDPCLNFVLNQPLVALPDLVVRPYHVSIQPSFVTPSEPVTIAAEVWNASGVFVGSADVALYVGAPDSGGALLGTQTLTQVYPWEKRTVSFNLGDLDIGDVTFYLQADADEAVAEADEANNLVGVSTYVYPCQLGFPLKLTDKVRGQVAADLDGDGALEILVTSGGKTAQAVDLDGNTLWARSDLGLSQWFDGVEPAAADLNGDGVTECVIPIKAGLVVAEGATGNEKWRVYTDYPCLSPVITDLDGDDTFEIVLATYNFTYSKICAYDASGSLRWVHSVPGAGEKVTGMVVCDPDLDGGRDIIYSTNLGRLTSLSCDVGPPAGSWQIQLSPNAISSIVGGDLERDGSIEIVANHDSTITVIDAASGDVEDAFTVGSEQCMWNLSLADADRDGVLEILAGSSCGEIGVIDGGVMTLHQYVEGTPFRAPVVADVDGDGVHEMVFSMSEGWLRIMNLDGTDQIPPLPMRDMCAVTPISDNIDGDPSVEMIVGSADSMLFILDLGQEGGVAEWSYAGCSSYRTNLYAQPLYGEVPDGLTLSGRVDVVGDVQVAAGTTLTLERHTDMRFMDDAVSPTGPTQGRCEITVEGTLTVRGSHSDRVKMRPPEYPPGKDVWQGVLLMPGSSGSFTKTDIQGAIAAIECRSSDVCVSECTISNSSIAVKVTSASPLIDSNLLTSNDYGISASGAGPVIVNNLITASRYNGIVLTDSADALVENNTVSGTLQGNGMVVYSSVPTISAGNRFENNYGSGIYLSNSSPVIDSCWISGSGDCGIKAAYYSCPVVSRTSLVSNKYGLGAFLSARPVLGDAAAGQGGLNDIRQNASYAIYNRTTYSVKAQMNWWGTEEPGPGLFYGSTDYSSWLTEPPAGVGPGGEAQSLVVGVYPNPFSLSVELRLAVGATDLPVAVSVYDVRGRLVKKMVSADPGGNVSVVWDGRDAFGNPAASGAYFVSVVWGNASQSRKVILVR